MVLISNLSSIPAALSVFMTEPMEDAATPNGLEPRLNGSVKVERGGFRQLD